MSLKIYSLRQAASSICQYVDNVFLTDEDFVCEIIKNFTLEFGSGSPQSDLKKLLADNPFVPPDLIDDVDSHLQGWVKKKIDLLLEQKRIAIISFDEFKNEANSYVRSVDNRTILSSFAPFPNKEEVEKNLLRTYIQQLELIDSNTNEKICAINDYIRAAIDRNNWAKNGIINEKSFVELEDKLRRKWQNTKTKTVIQYTNKSDPEQGKLIYSECMSFETDLQGLPLPPHFIPGNYHSLSEELNIGWHPNFDKLLSRKITGNNKI